MSSDFCVQPCLLFLNGLDIRTARPDAGCCSWFLSIETRLRQALDSFYSFLSYSCWCQPLYSLYFSPQIWQYTEMWQYCWANSSHIICPVLQLLDTQDEGGMNLCNITNHSRNYSVTFQNTWMSSNTAFKTSRHAIIDKHHFLSKSQWFLFVINTQVNKKDPEIEL